MILGTKRNQFSHHILNRFCKTQPTSHHWCDSQSQPSDSVSDECTLSETAANEANDNTTESTQQTPPAVAPETFRTVDESESVKSQTDATLVESDGIAALKSQEPEILDGNATILESVPDDNHSPVIEYTVEKLSSTPDTNCTVNDS